MPAYEFPASFGQRRMWLLSEMDPGEPTYNVPWAMRLEGELDAGALQRAWDAAVVRHEALRTTFRNESGLPVQVIDDEPATQPLLTASVEELPAQEREAAALALIRDLARQPFDLTKAPLARATLVRLSPEEHVLAVVMHHIVADGWSFRILFSELSADYAAIKRGGDPDSPEPPIQYADFALWQIEHAESGGHGLAERFWRAELGGAQALLPLPTDKPYPVRQSFAAETIYTTVDASGLGRHGTSLFAVYLAAYAAVIARITGSDDLLIAVPMAARTRPETEAVVGLFMNTVPIRVRIGQEDTLSDLVRSVHSTTVRVLEHQELPFARMVELARPVRDPARLPLVQVMFSMDEPWEVPDSGGLRWLPRLVDNGSAKFEMELTINEAKVRVNYNRDLFQASTGQLVADGFTAILRHLRDNPDISVADAEIMTPETLALVTSQWPSGPPVPEPPATALTQLWTACAGDSVVATGSDGTLTGDDVREMAQRITAALHEHGVGVSDRVAILLSRGSRLLPAILGIWSAGASYVPLDPIYPAQRLAAMLADSGAAAIVIDSSVADAPVPPPSALPVIDLKALAPASAEPVLDLPPSAVAVTMFTSGSTGRPKAVNVTQGGIGALLNAVRPLLSLGPQDKFVAISTFAFDIALVELLAPVLAGGCTVVADAWQVLDVPRLRELLAESGATALQATPAGWRMLLDGGGIPPEVKLRLTAGEPLSRDLADSIGTTTGARVWNLYGPTETTIYSGGDEVGPGPIEIGPIIAGTQLYVLDAHLKPVPPGVMGEIYIGGAGVAHGYHGAPAMTASRFVPDPFSARPGARLYRTGDVGKWRSSGRIELAGRADRQIKIRGYRIESGEVEAALRSHDDIAQAAVSVHGSGYDVRLVGYLVSRSGAASPPAGLREHLREFLPDYMVPAAFVVVPALPLTGSGKIDYRALPEPDWGQPSGKDTTAPRTPVEEKIAAMVAEVLALSAPVGVSDNFFALGGHSLTATRLMAQVRASYGVDLPLRTFFSDPTVAGLAAALTAGGR